MSSSETGLDFSEQVVPDHEFARFYDGGFVVGGVAIGDVDGDDVPDVFCAGTVKPSRLFRQTAPFQFEDVTESSGLSSAGNPWSVGASFADIDNDDDLDLYVCNFQSPNQLWINDGQGNFTEQAEKFGVDVNDASVMAYFGDFDKDGFLDLYLLTYRLYNEEGFVSEFDFERQSNGELVIVGKWKDYFKVVQKGNGKQKVRRKGREDYYFVNGGGRVFFDRTPTSGIRDDGQGMSVTLWDYDNDNDLDIYVCNDWQDPDLLYENQGDGTFKDVIKGVFKNVSWFSMGSDVADVNNDGRSDLYTVDMAGSNHYQSKILMGSMDAHKYFLDTAEPRQAMRNFLHLGAGSITDSVAGGDTNPVTRFIETAQYSGVGQTDWSWAPIVRDFDNDGFCDVFVTNGHIRNYNNPDFDAATTLGMKNKTFWNMHKNEKPLRQVNAAFRNTNGVRFEDTAAAWGLDHFGISYGAAYSDLDRDGDLDLVVMNMDEPMSVYRNETGNGNCITILLKGTQSNRDGIGTKIRMETEQGTQIYEHSPHRGYASTHEPLVHFGLGSQEKVKRLQVTWPSGIVQNFKDVDANQRLTITEIGEIGPSSATRPTPLFLPAAVNGISARKENPFDDFALQPLLPNKLSQLGPGVAVADLEEGERGALYIATPSGQTKSLEIASEPIDQAAGNYVPKYLKTGPAKEEMAPLFFDADGDGDLDLYIVCGGLENAGFKDVLGDTFLVNRDGKFVAANSDALPNTEFSGSTVTAADYDRDGDLDLFVGGRFVIGEYPTSPPSLLMRNESKQTDKPKFVDATDLDAAGLDRLGMVTSALWSDVDADGWIDLLVTTEWGPVRVFLNKAGQLKEATEQSGLNKYSGWWNGISAVDIDRDGDMDYVATNFGHNTKYKASKKKPAAIYYGKFGGNQKPAIIEVKTAEDCELPVRGKSCSQHAMPHLAEKFPTYHEFALADIGEIYTPTEIEQAQKFEATELSSCLLRNNGSGVFSVEPLPWQAQISPGFGVVATDFNADGWADLFIAQNFFTPQRETGRMSSGLSSVLMGSESGQFLALWPEYSGIAIEADAKGAAIADFNGDLRPDLVVGINDEKPRIFLNQASENQALVVRLVGSEKNKSAIGARVTVVLENGPPMTAEVSAGGGYLSQSTSDLFFGLGQSNKIKSIDIRWPDGSFQSLAGPFNPEKIVVIRNGNE